MRNCLIFSLGCLAATLYASEISRVKGKNLKANNTSLCICEESSSEREWLKRKEPWNDAFLPIETIDRIYDLVSRCQYLDVLKVNRRSYAIMRRRIIQALEEATDPARYLNRKRKAPPKYKWVLMENSIIVMIEIFSNRKRPKDQRVAESTRAQLCYR